ncbi:MAG TPA: FG-GAP-like repeat-containing protein [Myxococcaceae bacterium]|nr:FG-GAP-like repeat-containing protein [Myxococcaceae bacterium]
MKADPSTISPGDNVTLTWAVRFTPGCTQGPLSLSGRSVAATGSLTLNPMASATYTLTVRIPGGEATLAQTTVTVLLPPHVNIMGSTEEWKALLLQALRTENTFIHLDDSVDMNLSNLEGIPIAQGVTLTTEVAPPVRRGGVIDLGAVGGLAAPLTVTGAGVGDAAPVALSWLVPPKLGPRLHTTTRPSPLFEIVGDNVRLYGFRLIGPDFETMDGDEYLERGILINSHVGVEIAHMELAGWSGQAIYLVDDHDKMFNPDAVKIHDNYIHNNQHEGGNGYGVDVSAGAYALIEHNLFDFNRHAIAASGQPGVGYRANQNLVLKGGGNHAKWYSNYTHLFDVHGDKNCPDIPGNQNTWNCGNAGDQFWFTQNAFQYTHDNAIKLRGMPRVAAYIDGNVFAHGSVDDAIALQTTTHVTLGQGQNANHAGFDSYGRYGVCDLDGDGKDDLFLPTGVTWWYSSGGSMPWTYVAAADKKLEQIALGDFDGDQRCDVLTVEGNDWVITSGGNGVRRHYSGYDVPFEQVRFGRFNPDVRDHRTGRSLPITDAFRRTPDGQWWVVALGQHDWRAIGSSSIPLSQLRFGDFNGDGITDVLAVEGGHWSVSWGATSPWQTLNSRLSDSIESLIIADIDGNGRDDIVRFKPTSPTSGRLEVSWDGRTDWQTLTHVDWPPSATVPDLLLFAGRFDGSPGAGILFVDQTRFARLYTYARGAFVPYSLFAY